MRRIRVRTQEMECECGKSAWEGNLGANAGYVRDHSGNTRNLKSQGGNVGNHGGDARNQGRIKIAVEMAYNK